MQQLKLLNRKYRWLAFALYLLPFIFMPIFIILENRGVFSYDYFLRHTVINLVVLFWTFGAVILIFSRHRYEDEFIGSLRLLAFQKGIYFLIILMIFSLIISSAVKFWMAQYYGSLLGINSVSLLTMHFIYFNFLYRLRKSNVDEK